MDLLTWDKTVAHTCVMDIQTLCEKLVARRGEWTSIANRAGLSRRTIYRIVNGQNMPNLRTVMDLEGALASSKPRRSKVNEAA